MSLENATLKGVSLHYIGNKTHEQLLVLSSHPLLMDSDLADELNEHFLIRFTEFQEIFSFNHPSALQFNVVYNYVREAFNNDITFHSASEKIARHLYESSTHPKIKAGELYVCLFENCSFNGITSNAIGIFKTESKKRFFEVKAEQKIFDINCREGIEFGKFEKGCLIFNLDENMGYNCCVIDNQNRGEEAQYWREDFLGLEQNRNEYHQTKEFLNLTKNFVTKQLPTYTDVTKAEQIDLLNRSVAYFKSHESFDKQEFEEEVFQQQSIITSFRDFDATYCQENELELGDNFDISTQAVKKQAKVFKSVLKLDKNFHIYIHGNRKLIERGEDADGRKFYKIYFQEEH